MKKILTPIVFLLMVLPTIAQETAKDALKLATVCYEKELSQRLQFFAEVNTMNPDKTKKIETPNTDEVYNKLVLAYQELFTPQEISGLLAFYNSPLGAKMITKQTELQNKAMTIISYWEMKQNGVDMETLMPPVIENEAQFLARQQKEQEEQKEHASPKEKPFPKIANLEDLKKLVLKEPQLINDPRLLEEIIGKQEFEKLFSPPISIDQEIKDPNKKTK
jgi:hypothetical protein